MAISALTQLEGNILIWMQNNIRTPFLNVVMGMFSDFGTGGVLWIIVTLILLFFRKTRRIGVYSGISILLTLLVVNGIIKPIVRRPRPYTTFAGLIENLRLEKDSGCFPSGHSANSFTCAWVLLRRMKKKIGVPALIVAALISFSRLYIGVHYPTDVLVGAVSGIAMAEVSLHFAKPYMKPILKALGKLPFLQKKKKKAKKAR